ncbi:hypothetical protein AAFN47_26925 [Hoeflea sp. CAU 1731]
MKNPPRWSERLVVNFEKDITLALFMVRRLAEAGKFSSRFKNHQAKVFRCPFSGRPHRLIYKDIDELYELETEECVSKSAMFVCNQFIHADFTYAIRREDRNWDGLYTSSDFEKRKWIYRIPITEIIDILELAVEDEPTIISWRYNPDSEDWIVKTD